MGSEMCIRDSGKDADVVVTSGHPFDWNGSIRAVFLNGRRVK